MKHKGEIMNKIIPSVIAMLLFAVGFSSSAPADTPKERVQLTYIVASNTGNDFNLDNDAYRDQMMKLFSYTSYQQLDRDLVELARAEREKVALPDGYELLLTYQGADRDRYMLQAVIRKGGQVYVDTVLSVLKPGVVFLGGPPTDQGDLIIILEMGF